MKTDQEILESVVEKSLKEFERPNTGLFLSSVAAGLEISFSVMFMGVFYSLFSPAVTKVYTTFIVALAYPVGFIFVVLGKSQLFTEHTTLAFLPVIDGKKSVKALLILFLIIYAGNLVGGYLMALLIVGMGKGMHNISADFFSYVGHRLVNIHWYWMLLSGIVAGWLMGLLTWLTAATEDTSSPAFIVILIAFLIGAGHLHHSIAGSVEVFTNLIAGSVVTLKDFLTFQVWSTVGNIIGGCVFVALLKYGVSTRSA